jgi:DeoR/GlpR family transcriptional regulator of sugar metabolism
MELRVLTNSFAAATLLLEAGACEVMITGGQLDRSSEVIFSYLDDPLATAYPPDVAFLGAQAVDGDKVYNSDERLIRLERRVIESAGSTVLLADSSKFGNRGRIRICDMESIDVLVTDAGIPAESRDLIERSNTRLIITR